MGVYKLDRSKVPHHPGVYIYRDFAAKVLYVGKAIDLNKRVSSYFSQTSDSKIAVLVKNIAEIETIVVESEMEALILEANLIKKYLPPFNLRLTDDKDYLYIVVTAQDYPRIITARKKDLAGTHKHWGPFPSSKTVRNTLKSLRRVFPWCTNISNIHSRSGYSKTLLEWKYKPCFYYHLGLCPGPCAGAISQKDYHKIIQNFTKFMDGKKTELLAELTKEMTELSKKQKFEQANSVKKDLLGISYLTQPNRTSLYLENPNFLEEENKLAVEQLQKDLNMNRVPYRIEGYDISNIQGKEATGSMVVLTNGETDKSQYRKFKIRISGKPNDVGMHKEMISRRLKHPEWPLPDLIIVDGGRGQAKAVKSEIRNPKSEIPVYGLAKRLEWLYPPEGEVIILSKRSLSLKLLQKLRDEAHRFAIAYHRKLRDKIILS